MAYVDETDIQIELNWLVTDTTYDAVYLRGLGEAASHKVDAYLTGAGYTLPLTADSDTAIAKEIALFFVADRLAAIGDPGGIGDEARRQRAEMMLEDIHNGRIVLAAERPTGIFILGDDE